jgi:hypothetical protein
MTCVPGLVGGLIGTLVLLGFTHHALPALPISIALGVLAYLGAGAHTRPLFRST